jgi:hypothetical protein
VARVAKKDRGVDGEVFRGKARDVLAKADDAADLLIAGELKLLAERYMNRARELEDRAIRRARRLGLTPRRQKSRAAPRPSSGAYRGDI